MYIITHVLYAGVHIKIIYTMECILEYDGQNKVESSSSKKMSFEYLIIRVLLSKYIFYWSEYILFT